MIIKRITAEVVPGIIPRSQRIEVRVQGDKTEYCYHQEVPEDHFESLFEVIWRDIGREITAKSKSKAA